MLLCSAILGVGPVASFFCILLPEVCLPDMAPDRQFAIEGVPLVPAFLGLPWVVVEAPFFQQPKSLA